MKKPERWILKVDADRIAAEQEARQREIWLELHERLLARIRAFHDWRIAAAEEVHRALARVDTASAAFERDFAALPSLPKPFAR